MNKILGYILKFTFPLKNDLGWENFRKEVRDYYLNIRKDKNSQISDYLIKMLISAEDHRYFKHLGVDFYAVIRALLKTIFLGKREGASTIKMQTVRVLTGNFEKSILRKIKEMKYAVRLEEVIPNCDIPEFYLRIAYYGWKMNGINQASQRMKKDLKNISLKDASSMIARLKYPEPKVSSLKRSSQIEMRTNHILKLFEKHEAKGIYNKLNDKGVLKWNHLYYPMEQKNY